MATFGKTTIGGSSAGTSDRKVACRFQLTENGTVTSITLYCNQIGSNYKVAIYTDNAGAPDALKVQSDSVAIDTVGWHEFIVTSTALTAGYYWLTLMIEAWGTSTCVYDAGVLGQYNESGGKVYANEFTDPFGTVELYTNLEVSIYATYTTGAPPPKGTITIHAKLANII